MDDYEFDQQTGLHKNKKTDQLVCTSCLLNQIVSPVKESPSRWHCQRKECDKLYKNPEFKSASKRGRVLSPGIPFRDRY